MQLYRIAKSERRSIDISGSGAFNIGGRWNNEGTYMLYTSENSSLAYLETLVHFDENTIPPFLFITTIEINDSALLVYQPSMKSYPEEWMLLDNLENKKFGDRFIAQQSHLALKVYSAINPAEFNYLLNPLFPNYHKLVKITAIDKIDLDKRFIKTSK